MLVPSESTHFRPGPAFPQKQGGDRGGGTGGQVVGAVVAH